MRAGQLPGRGLPEGHLHPPASQTAHRDRILAAAGVLPCLLGAATEASQEEEGVPPHPHPRVHHLLQVPAGQPASACTQREGHLETAKDTHASCQHVAHGTWRTAAKLAGG